MTQSTPSPSEPAPTLISEFAEALHARKIRLLDREDRGSPLPAYAQAHRRLFRQLNATLTAINTMEETRAKELWKGSKTSEPQVSADAFQDLTYRMTELMDFYEKDIPYYLSLNTGSKFKESLAIYLKRIKSLRGIWATICNRCKHNHRYLVPVEGHYYDNQMVCGISMYGRVGEHVAPDPILHSQSDAMSYNWLLRNLIYSIITADSEAAEFVRLIPDSKSATGIISLTYSLPYPTVFRDIIMRPDTSMPGEIMFPDISIDESYINIDVSRPATIDQRAFNLRMWADIFGHQLVLQTPYLRESARLDLNPEQGPHGPIGAFLRVDISDLKVPART